MVDRFNNVSDYKPITDSLFFTVRPTLYIGHSTVVFDDQN
jgi:hypothetical protein